MNHSLLYYRNSLGCLTYDSRGYVVLEWSSAAVTDDELHSLYSHTLQALRHHDTCKLLTNQTARQPLSEQEQAWIVEKWIPQAIADCAYSHCAIVESPHVSSRVAARAVGSSVNHPLDFRYFQDEADAHQWLQTT